MSRISCLGLSIAPLLGGCLFMGGGHAVRIDESARIPIRFESIAASNDFHAGMAHADRTDYTDGGGFVVLLLAGAGESEFHETPFYNAQVRRADIDRDERISNDEARAYREAMTAPPRGP